MLIRNPKLLPQYSKWHGLSPEKIALMKQRKNPNKIQRKNPCKKDQIRILKRQGGICAYCGIELTLDGLNKELEKVVWDHFLPISKYKSNKTSNFVASCKKCNSIKSNKVFKTKMEVKLYIFAKIKVSI